MRLSNRCYAVTGLAYQLPWVVNAGFIVGDEETLIVDTGANALAAATIHGYAEAARPLNRLRVVNTEQHFDHIGGNGFFRELDIPIHGHAGIARTPAEFEQERKSFHAAFHFATGLTALNWAGALSTWSRLQDTRRRTSRSSFAKTRFSIAATRSPTSMRPIWTLRAELTACEHGSTLSVALNDWNRPPSSAVTGRW